MRTTTNNNTWNALMVVACLIATPVMAQSKVADGDLLKMLETANSEVAAPVQPEKLVHDAELSAPAVQTLEETSSATDSLSRVLDSVKAAAEPAPEIDMLDPALEDANVAPDELGMEGYDAEAVSSSDQLISVRLNKVGLEEAINLFAQLSGANIIVPELAEASQLSVNLKDVEWRPALQSILDTYNYELYQKVAGSNVYSVRRRPEGAPEPQVVETFKLRYATVQNVAALVRELLPPDAKISEFASRNMIVVKSSESSLSEIRAVIETIDTVRQQVFIESKFMELSDGAQEDLGIDWQVLKSYSAGTVGSTQRGYTRNETDISENSNLREGTSSGFTDAAGNTYAQGSGFSLGGSLDPVTPVYQGLTPTLSESVNNLVGGSNKKTTTDVLTSVLSADEFRLILSALQENKGVNLVSNPKIIVANEEKANISIVRKEPNLKQERQQTAGAQGGASIDNITFALDPDQPFFEYGIKLDVIPSINTSSNITVNINPSLTRKFGDKLAGSNTYPIIDEKTISTVFNLTSGQTAAIGGLTEVEDSEIERKVPILGSIPYLGRLFSWKQTVSDQRETIIFVTVALANTMEIDSETGLPEDSELARRRIIKDRNSKTLRSQSREYYQAEEDHKLGDMLKVMRQNENERVQKRGGVLNDEIQKADEVTAQDKNETV